jgi:RNA polymerase sigma factor (sigma-70 family)
VAAVAPLPAETTGLLYEQYHQRIFGFCLSQLGSREDAEDAVQTTFINAQRGLRRGVVPRFELAWLFTIARNVCHNSRDSASRRGRVEAVRDLDALQDVVALPERGGDLSLGELMQALGAIPERQRQALLLREFQGLSYDEIAKELAVSVAAVETLIFRARRSVAEQTGRKQTRGVLAWVLALVRWPLQGGAAPLKLAVVTATVATTATLGVAPLLREPAVSKPAPAAPQADTLRRDVGVVPLKSRQPASPTKTRPTVAETVVPVAGPQVTPPAVHTDTSPAQTTPTTPTTAPPVQVTAPPATRDVSTSIAPPEVTVPSVLVGPVTTPEVAVTIPEVKLPLELPLELPAVDVPLVPALPPLP